ncbi:hypothetical protein Tco_1292172 [Tanacetum coccineum]
MSLCLGYECGGVGRWIEGAMRAGVVHLEFYGSVRCQWRGRRSASDLADYEQLTDVYEFRDRTSSSTTSFSSLRLQSVEDCLVDNLRTSGAKYTRCTRTCETYPREAEFMVSH